MLTSLFRTASAQAPAAPTNLTAASGSGAVTLSWIPIAQEPHAGTSAYSYTYKVYRGTYPGGEASTPIGQTASAYNPATSSYTDTTANGSVLYYYQVTVVRVTTQPGVRPPPPPVTNESARSNEASTAPVVAGLTLNPNPVLYGATSTGTVTLSGPAFSGGQTVSLSSSNTAATVTPTSLNVPAGYTTANFTVTTGSAPTPPATTTAVISAACPGTGAQQTTLTVVSYYDVTDLAAYATGSGKITLYWSGVTSASGYNVYRGTTAGGEDYNNPVNGNTPVITQDTGPGVSNLFQFSDTGLTNGQQYFYTVKAVYGATLSDPSNEDSDAPTPTAIPWDSGDSSAIVSAIEQSDSNQPGLPYSIGYCSPRVMGPDGVIYQNGISNALPPDGAIDPGGRTMTLNGQITDASLFLLEASANTASSAAVPLAYGGIRRVTSVLYPGPATGPNANTSPFDGVSGTYYLPTTSDSGNFFLNPNYPPYNKLIDSPNLYVGLTTDQGPEVDAGIYFSPPTTLSNGTQLPNRWHAFMRVSDGRYNYYNNLPPLPGTLRAMGDVYSYIDADSQIGNDASLSFSVNLQDHVANLVVFGTDYGGLYYARWYVAALHSFKLGGPLNGLRMKRQVSLDQTRPGNATPVAFSNAVAPHSPTGDKVTTAGYFSTGSYMLNISWQGGTLYQGQNSFSWTQNYWDTTLHRTYMSMVGNTPDVVTVGQVVGSSNPADETVSIHH